MKDQTKVIAALLIGAAAGAALGLLLAPEKGETVRDGIADYINDLVDSAKERAIAKTNDVKKYGSDLYDKAKNTITDAIGDATDYKDQAIDTARAKGQDLKNEAQRRFNDGKASVKNGSNDVNDAIQNA
jgi:gas vesicle protein